MRAAVPRVNQVIAARAIDYFHTCKVSTVNDTSRTRRICLDYRIARRVVSQVDYFVLNVPNNKPAFRRANYELARAVEIRSSIIRVKENLLAGLRIGNGLLAAFVNVLFAQPSFIVAIVAVGKTICQVELRADSLRTLHVDDFARVQLNWNHVAIFFRRNYIGQLRAAQAHDIRRRSVQEQIGALQLAAHQRIGTAAAKQCIRDSVQAAPKLWAVIARVN